MTAETEVRPAAEAVSDAAVIAASATDPAGFATVFDRHATAIRNYLARRIGPQSAEDLTGETFLIAFSRRGDYDRSHPSALPWLYGIASNLVRHRRRAEVRQLRALARTGVDDVLADHADSVSARVAAQSSTRALAGALAGLTAGERDVLLLMAWAGLSYDELAAALDIPIGTVRSRLHRARTKVRAALTNTKEKPDA
jgi:RNA polymerase sigma-70 factor (ECF subfamily)